MDSVYINGLDNIEKCKSEKAKLFNKLKQYYSTEISKLRQYL